MQQIKLAVILLMVWLTAFTTASLSAADASTAPATGPLRIHPDNPRYFMDPSGKISYLTAAHTWANLQEIGVTDPPPVFDYERYLKFLADPGSEYLVYQPASGRFSVKLVAGTYSYEWFNPAVGKVDSSGSVKTDSGERTFEPPFSGDAVLYLKLSMSR